VQNSKAELLHIAYILHIGPTAAT